MSDYFKKRMEELGLSDNESTSGSTQKQSNYFVERVKALGLDQVSSKASASGSPKWSAPTEKNSAVDEGRNILLGYDLNAGSSTIKELETKYNEAKKIQDAIDERVALVLYGQSRAGNLQASRENVMASDNVVAELQKQLAAYGDLDALEKDLKEKKRYHTLAERAQNGVKLASVVENEDFLENSKYVSTEIKRETFWDRFRKGEYGLGYEDLTHQYINGDEDFRAEVGRKHATYSMDNVFDDGESRFEEANLDQMNADEIKIYNYHYNTGGKEKAEEYLDSIQETLNYRKAEKEFALYEDNVALELMFGVEAGLDQFESGIENLFSNEDYIPTSDTQMTSGMVREDLADSGAKLPEWLGGSSVGQVGYDLVTNTSNMLPSILTSAVSNVVVPGSGAITGSVLLGASASGNAYAEMVNLGYTKGQARAYSTLVGASEAALQYALGGISKLGGKVSGNAVSKLVSKIDNAFARTAIKLGGNMASEGLEEAIQTALEPAFKALATGEDFESAEWDEILYSALLGAVSGGIFEGADIGASHVSTAINDYKVGKDIISKAEAAENFDSVAALKSLAYEMAGDQKTFADKQLAKTAGKIDYMNLKAGNVGKTQRLVSESISKQNAADIQKALVEKGLSNKESAQIAEYLLRASEGQLYSDSEREQAKIEAKIAGDDRIVDVLRDVIGNPDSDVNARWGNLHNALQGGKQTTADTQTSAPVQEATPEVMKGDHKVSESGKTLYTNENGETEEVNIQKIVSTDGGIKVALDNGKTVNAKDLELSTDAEAMAFEMVTRMEATPETAQVIFEAVKASDATSAEELFLGVPTAYRYGKINYEAGLANISIPDAIKKLAYNRGKVDAMTSPKSKKKVASKQTKKTNAKKSETKQYSKVIFEGFEYSEDSATDIQKASMKAIDALSKMSNFLEIHVYESKVVNGERYAIVDGKKITANGYFKVGTNKVYVDINAGNKGEGLSLYTLGHEVTHPIAEWNWEDFKKLGDFLIENFGKNNVPVDELINEKMKVVANSYKLDGQAVPSENKLFMEAYEEVVADSMSSMFADPNSYVKLAEFKKQDKTLWQKFGDVIKAILDKLKSLLGVYDGVSYESKEAEHVSKFSRDVYDKLQDLYIKAFVGAEANYQASNLVSIDTASESVSPKFSERTWSESEYVTEREETAKKIAQALGVDIKTAYKYIDDINGVARLIADDRARLDYEPNLDEKASVLKPNSEYKFSVDMSTLCAKRLLFTGTFDAIQKALPNTVFDSEDIVSLREMMQKRGYEVACGICYVESTRREIGRITQEFIDRYKVAQKTGKPISRINSSGKEVVLKSAGRTFSADKNYTPNLGELNTTDIDFVKRDHREVYDAYLAFMNARGQAKPKLLETRAEYKGEILKHFKAKSAVEARNNAGGLRLQSFSDFEVPHMIDMMQIVMDMSRVGLKSQAYTKVPAFAEVFGDSGVKINLSLIAKGDGLDAKGNLIFDDVEGINHEEAFNLRDKYSKNVGTILVGKTDAHIIAAMADPRIDYIIPFHKSSWKESLYDALGLTGYADYTDFQNEKPIDKDRKISNFDPSEYWDFTKTGDENAQTYLDKCREDGRIPKFPQFQGYPGYWKLLIDFKMYDNDGVGSPQEVVKPVFNTEASERILNAYEGGHKSFPVAKDVVEDFVKEHSENNGVKYSLRVKYTNGTEIIANPYETTREQVLEFMQMARKGQLENYSYFPVSSDTSKTIISTLKNAGIIVENRPLAMQVDKARQSQINAKPINKNGFTIRYHAMSAEKILEVINNLDDAIAIIQQRNRTTTKERPPPPRRWSPLPNPPK